MLEPRRSALRTNSLLNRLRADENGGFLMKSRPIAASIFVSICCRRTREAFHGVIMGLFGFIFGNSNKDKSSRDRYRPSVILKNAISPLNTYGTCFACDGSGAKVLDCRACDGTGTHAGQCRSCRGSGRFERPAQQCFGCNGSGAQRGHACARCKGSGVFKPAISEPCRKCNGTGRFQETCRKCEGRGHSTVPCSKCDGSGWHKHPR